MIHVFTCIHIFKNMKNRKKYDIVKKTLRKASCIFHANFNDFCLHFGSQNPSKKLSALAFFRYFSQDTSKMPPRRPKTPPRHLQDASKALQEASKTCLRPPKTPLDSPKTPSSCPETPQECYKIEGFEKSVNFLMFFIRFFLIFHVFRLPMERKRADPSE